ncbi:MAG: glycosyltransferase family 2 protein [Acidimicrobiia bacterium]|nr:glycosyltransferase family 2 protein [Acidimicrobiia bacterium]
MGGRNLPASSRVLVVLPALNEESGLRILLERIERAMLDASLPFEVIVVDDGSTDRTAEVAREYAEWMPLRLISHPVNLGLGTSIKDGLLEAVGIANPQDILVTLDADNTHTPELILRLVRMIREGHDVVIASRFRPGSRVRGVPILRSLLSFFASFLLRVLFPIKGVRDYTSGYRAYRAGVFQTVVANEGEEFFDQDGFQVMVDILLKLRRDRDLIFGEAPMILRYDAKEGASKMDVVRTTKATLALIVRRRLRE